MVINNTLIQGLEVDHWAQFSRLVCILEIMNMDCAWDMASFVTSDRSGIQKTHTGVMEG
jgi:hypothetical protein